MVHIRHAGLLGLLLALVTAHAPAAPAAPPQRALEVNNSAASRIAELERELQKIALAPVFEAAALTSPDRVLQGQATIARLRELTTQRRELARRHAADLASLQRRGARSPGVDDYLAQARRVHDELHEARAEVADAADAVLLWAKEQGTTIRTEHGRIKMSSLEQQAQFNALFARLEAGMTRHERAVDASEAHRKAYLGRLRHQPVPSQY